MNPLMVRSFSIYCFYLNWNVFMVIYHHRCYFQNLLFGIFLFSKATRAPSFLASSTSSKMFCFYNQNISPKVLIFFAFSFPLVLLKVQHAQPLYAFLKPQVQTIRKMTVRRTFLTIFAVTEM